MFFGLSLKCLRKEKSIFIIAFDKIMSMKQIVFIAMLFLGSYQAIAQNIKRPETYNYLRGHEAIQEQKYEDALDYFNKDVQENPKN